MKRWSPEQHWVDKSDLIREFLRCRQKTVMVCAPQGFLKSSNLEMIASFLSLEENSEEKENRRYQWRNLNVMRKKQVVEKYFCQYPVVFVPAGPSNTACTMESLLIAIRLAFWDHKELLRSPVLTDEQKRIFKTYAAYTYEQIGNCDYRLGDALKTLCDFLYAHYRKRVYVFFDNYDSYLLDAIAKNKPLCNIMPMLKKLVSNLCESPGLKRVMLACITSSIDWRYYDEMMKDFKAYKFLGAHKFTKYFGFTEGDIRHLANRNRCSIEITDRILNSGYSTFKKWRLYSPEWVHDFLQHSKIENDIWFESTLQKRNLHIECARRNKLRTLIEGGCVDINPEAIKVKLDPLQLNRLLNGSYEEPMNEEEVDLVVAFLYEMGALTFVDHKNRKLSLDCWTQNRGVKFTTNNTSRIGANLASIIRNNFE